MATRKNTQQWNWDNIKFYLEIIVAFITVLSAGFGIGCWASHIEHQNTILELNQKHNIEITNLKLDYNNRLIEARTEHNNHILSLENEILFLKSKEATNGNERK